MDTDKVESIPRKAGRTVNGVKAIYIGNFWDLWKVVLISSKIANIIKHL